MATKEQRDASRQVCNAVTALNRALSKASDEGLFVELNTASEMGGRNKTYFVSVVETRETVLPDSAKEAAQQVIGALTSAGFAIVPRRRGAIPPHVGNRGPGPRPLMTNAIAGAGPRRGVFCDD